MRECKEPTTRDHRNTDLPRSWTSTRRNHRNAALGALHIGKTHARYARTHLLQAASLTFPFARGRWRGYEGENSEGMNGKDYSQDGREAKRTRPPNHQVSIGSTRSGTTEAMRRRKQTSSHQPQTSRPSKTGSFGGSQITVAILGAEGVWLHVAYEDVFACTSLAALLPFHSIICPPATHYTGSTR
ncbi:hypothetical protein ZHAS_00021636 [Anopheles sinensis]|uniref:Uncharacterized protein n=1 Tax=Anopheles sinensis TaxID=74873 RepID=A0A084WSY5_ANOSI|nr:hypothetical protein ZHAS_00021636 [Anopheles sinensis]